MMKFFCDYKHYDVSLAFLYTVPTDESVCYCENLKHVNIKYSKESRKYPGFGMPSEQVFRNLLVKKLPLVRSFDILDTGGFWNMVQCQPQRDDLITLQLPVTVVIMPGGGLACAGLLHKQLIIE